MARMHPNYADDEEIDENIHEGKDGYIGERQQYRKLQALEVDWDILYDRYIYFDGKSVQIDFLVFCPGKGIVVVDAKGPGYSWSESDGWTCKKGNTSEKRKIVSQIHRACDTVNKQIYALQKEDGLWKENDSSDIWGQYSNLIVFTHGQDSKLPRIPEGNYAFLPVDLKTEPVDLKKEIENALSKVEKQFTGPNEKKNHFGDKDNKESLYNTILTYFLGENSAVQEDAKQSTPMEHTRSNALLDRLTWGLFQSLIQRFYLARCGIPVFCGILCTLLLLFRISVSTWTSIGFIAGAATGAQFAAGAFGSFINLCLFLAILLGLSKIFLLLNFRLFHFDLNFFTVLLAGIGILFCTCLTRPVRIKISNFIKYKILRSSVLLNILIWPPILVATAWSILLPFFSYYKMRETYEHLMRGEYTTSSILQVSCTLIIPILFLFFTVFFIFPAIKRQIANLHLSAKLPDCEMHKALLGDEKAQIKVANAFFYNGNKRMGLYWLTHVYCHTRNRKILVAVTLIDAWLNGKITEQDFLGFCKKFSKKQDDPCGDIWLFKKIADLSNESTKSPNNQLKEIVCTVLRTRDSRYIIAFLKAMNRFGQIAYALEAAKDVRFESSNNNGGYDYLKFQYWKLSHENSKVSKSAETAILKKSEEMGQRPREDDSIKDTVYP